VGVGDGGTGVTGVDVGIGAGAGFGAAQADNTTNRAITGTMTFRFLKKLFFIAPPCSGDKSCLVVLSFNSCLEPA